MFAKYQQDLTRDSEGPRSRAETDVAPAPKTSANATSSPLTSEPETAAPGTQTATLPRLSEYQEEAGANPHATPPSLIRFTRALAPKLEAAEADETKARALVAELRNCVTQGEVSALRTYCVSKAKGLAKRFDRLQSESDDLESRLSESEKTQLRAMMLLE